MVRSLTSAILARQPAADKLACDNVLFKPKGFHKPELQGSGGNDV